MAKTGRKELFVKRQRVEIQLPDPLFAKVELLLLNPLNSRRKYGALSKLVEQLLTDWVKKQQQQTLPNNLIDWEQTL